MSTLLSNKKEIYLQFPCVSGRRHTPYRYIADRISTDSSRGVDAMRSHRITPHLDSLKNSNSLGKNQHPRNRLLAIFLEVSYLFQHSCTDITQNEIIPLKWHLQPWNGTSSKSFTKQESSYSMSQMQKPTWLGVGKYPLFIEYER